MEMVLCSKCECKSAYNLAVCTVLGVLPPINVNFAAHQLGESLTIVWKHPPCDQTFSISGYVVAYSKLTDSDCDSIPAS